MNDAMHLPSKVPSQVVQDLVRRYQSEVDRLCAIAFPAGCSVAIRQHHIELDANEYALFGAKIIDQVTWEFVILAEGETPPGGGWTFYCKGNRI